MINFNRTASIVQGEVADAPAFARVTRVTALAATLVTEAKVGHWGQGVVWSRDGKTLLVQSMIEKELEVLSFDGKELKQTGAIKVNGGPAGIRTAQH